MIDGRAWLTDNIEQARGVSEAAWKTVADFALLWSLFEAELCAAHASPYTLVSIADSLDDRALEEGVNAAFDYWRARYIEGASTNQRFNELFVETGGRTVAESILLADAPDERSKLKCALLIVYRLRNNLFHGTKEIRTFNDQKENLDHGTAVLATVMGWAGVR